MPNGTRPQTFRTLGNCNPPSNQAKYRKLTEAMITNSSADVSESSSVRRGLDSEVPERVKIGDHINVTSLAANPIC